MSTEAIRRVKKSAALRYLEKLIGGSLTMGKILRSLRECDEITQQEFAECLGISKQNLCDIEKGRKFVSSARAAVFAERLGFPAAFFMKVALQEELDRIGSRVKIKSIDAA